MTAASRSSTSATSRSSSRRGAASCGRSRRSTSPSPRARRSASSASPGSGKSVTSYAVMRILDRAGPHRRGHASRSPASTCARAPESEMRDLRGREISMIFQNPRAALNPIRKVGRQIEDVLRPARPGRSARRARDKAIESAAPGPHRPARGALSRLSVRAFGRHVPAHRHRARARLPAAAPDRRRADDRPRRDDAEGGDGPHRRADARARHVDDPHHPRSRPRRRLLRQGRRDGEGPRRRDRRVRAIFRAPEPRLHAQAHAGDAAARHRAARPPPRARRLPRRAPAVAAVGEPLLTVDEPGQGIPARRRDADRSARLFRRDEAAGEMRRSGPSTASPSRCGAARASGSSASPAAASPPPR